MKNHPIKTMPVKALLATAFLTLLTAVAVRAADATDRGQFSASDYKFAVAAASGGATEVTLGQLAAQKGGNEAVRQFGQRMVDDHGKANKELQDLASRKGANLPTGPDATQQKHIDHLVTLTGSDFDKAYISFMLEAHRKDLKAFKHAAEKADDADLRAFAANTTPVVEEHLRMLESMQIARTGANQ